METVLEISCSEIAALIVDEYASKRKLNKIQLAAMIPGLVHDHAPTTKIVENCVYCQRNGNVFAPEDVSKETGDIISKYKKKMETICVEMKNEIETTLDSHIV